MRLLYSFLIFWPLTTINLIFAFFTYKYFGWRQGDQGRSRASSNWGYFQYFYVGSKLEIDGLDNIPREGGVIIASNHRSYYDIFTICAAMPRDVRWVVKDQLLHYPVLGPVLKRIRAIGLDRANPRDALKVLMTVAKELQGGDAVAIFPEGTRSDSLQMKPFKNGVFALAQKAGVPVVPVAIQGTEKILPTKKLLVSGGHRVKITFLPPIDTKSYGKNRQKLSDDIHQLIQEKLDTPY